MGDPDAGEPGPRPREWELVSHQARRRAELLGGLGATALRAQRTAPRTPLLWTGSRPSCPPPSLQHSATGVGPSWTPIRTPWWVCRMGLGVSPSAPPRPCSLAASGDPTSDPTSGPATRTCLLLLLLPPGLAAGHAAHAGGAVGGRRPGHTGGPAFARQPRPPIPTWTPCLPSEGSLLVDPLRGPGVRGHVT